jgi:ABC-type glycerol-3-phosphate transport system permease component
MSDFFTFERELQWPTAAAALVVSLLPLVALVTVAHRALERFTLRSEETA